MSGLWHTPARDLKGRGGQIWGDAAPGPVAQRNVGPVVPRGVRPR